MNKPFHIFLFGLVIFLAGCKDKEADFEPGYDYYPVEVGDYKIYQAKLINYSPSGSVSQSFEIKEVVTEVFTINGEPRYRLERFHRDNSSQPWPVSPDSIWSVSVTQSKVVKVENNVRFVKLVFPVSNGKSWNGNVENTWGEDDYTIQNLGAPYTVSSQTFANTLSVLQSPNDSSSFISKDYRNEIYAKGVGMIYKTKEVYNYKQNSDGTIRFDFIIDDGIRYSERLISYGRQ